MDSASIEGALESDAERGVDVTVVMTADSEWDAAFSQLESDGVHVVLYPDTASALYIHAKVIDVDSTKAFIGSENFSTASLDYNRELGLITSSAAVLGPLEIGLVQRHLERPTQGGRALRRRRRRRPPRRRRRRPQALRGGLHPDRRRGRVLRAGEYCRDDDHGTTGRAGDGQTITCEDENGTWYWETT